MEDRLISRCLPSRAHSALRCLFFLVFLQPRFVQFLRSWSHLGHFLSLPSVLPLASTQSRQASLRLPCKQISTPKQVVHREALTSWWQRKLRSRRRSLATCCSDDHRQQRTPQSSTRSKLMARGRLWQKRAMHAAVVHRVAKRGRTFGSAFSSSCSAAARGLPMCGATCGECGWMKRVCRRRIAAVKRNGGIYRGRESMRGERQYPIFNRRTLRSAGGLCRFKVLSELLVDCIVLRPMRNFVSINLIVGAAADNRARPVAGTVEGVAAKYKRQTSSKLHGGLA